MILPPLVRYVLTAAFRDKLMMTLFLMILIGSSLSIFLGSSAITEEISFSVVFAAGGLRFLGVIGLVLFICFYIRRAFDHKEVEFMLSRPMSRLGYLITHSFAFTILASIIGLCLMGSIALLGHPPLDGILAWGFSIIIELIIMANIALFFSMVLSSAAGSALACLGFYALARMIGTILGITDAPANEAWLTILGQIMEFFSIIIPRFDLMGQTAWLVYGAPDLSSLEFSANMKDKAKFIIETIGLLGYIFAQGIVFTYLIISATYYDLIRRQF